MSKRTIEVESGGEALLAVLADRGVDYLFGNAGTDFPSIIEAFAKAAAGKASAPMPITVPHENLAVAMAHGVALATGRAQAVMLHVNVGTANAVCGLLNATRENIPLLLMAGRTPIMEDDATGARSVYIHWGQEMFDQAGMVREAVKWDYELRTPGQIEAVADRALTIANSAPKGPVYLSLPREVVASGGGEFAYSSPSVRAPASPAAPDPAAIDQLAGWLAEARFPVIVTGSFGRDPEEVPALAALAEKAAIPVVGYRPRYAFLPSDHPMNLGTEPGELISRADLILVLECDVPWVPKLYDVPDDARVVHLGADPLFERYPMRSFRADLAIAAAPGLALKALDAAVGDSGNVAGRRAEIEGLQAIRQDRRAAAVAAAPTGASTAPWIAACLNQVKRDDDIIVTEAPFPVGLLDLPQPGTFFGTSTAGGLGWGLGAALGLKLGAPERRVIAAVGDGAYIFGNPTPAHFVAAANGLPTLTIILNNRMWAAVRRATLSLYPDGEAARSNRAPLTYLEPSPEYHKIIEASGGYGEKVEDPADLPAALARALAVVDDEKRPAVLNVITEYSDQDALRDAKR